VLTNKHSPLTVLIPTRNRLPFLSAQLRFFKECGLRHPIRVIDSSNPQMVAQTRAACCNTAEYQRVDPELRLVEKLLKILDLVETPFVVLAADDDVTFPHAIDSALTYLQSNPDYVAAQGYVLQFAIHRSDVDIHDVVCFTPTIGEDDPLQRHYNLMRRYQAFYWGVFRTEVLATALKAAHAMNGIVFRELTVMNTVVLQGKVVRLPVIYGLRGPEVSVTPIAESHPFFWFLNNAESFFQSYRTYRDALARFIRDRGVRVPDRVALEQVLDMVHTTWLGRELNLATVNHAARHLLGDPVRPGYVAHERRGWHPPADGDVVHQSVGQYRRYVWRHNVIEAEPRDEISISGEEMSRIERQLDAYHPSDIEVT